MYICMYIDIYVHTLPYICIHIYTYIHIYTCMYFDICVHMLPFLCTEKNPILLQGHKLRHRQRVSTIPANTLHTHILYLYI